MKRKLLLALLAALLLGFVGFAGLYKTSWRFRHDCQVIARTGVSRLAVSWNRGGEPVTLTADGLRIAGELHRPAGEEPFPAVLLLHGSSPQGRKLGLYRVLGRGLAERGYLVLSIDVRGYGDSDDPASLEAAEDLDAAGDVLAGLRYLAGRPGVDRQRIFIVGHSMGAGLALRAAPHTDLVQGLVAIGPPRRVWERLERELADVRRRYSHDRELDGLVPEQLIDEVTRAWSMESFRDYYAGEDHPPVLLIDGALEDPRDLEFLREYHAGMSEPKRYVTVAGTAHYFSAVNPLSGPLVFHDGRLMDEVLDTIDAWLRQAPQAPGR